MSGDLVPRVLIPMPSVLAPMLYWEFERQTTRWERFLLRAGLMSAQHRREVLERLRPWFEEWSTRWERSGRAA